MWGLAPFNAQEVTVSNPGHKAVIINTPKITFPGRDFQVFMPHPQSTVRFPHRLEEGTKCEVWMDLRELANELSKRGCRGKTQLRAEVGSHAGDSYKSKVFILDVDGWLKERSR